MKRLRVALLATAATLIVYQGRQRPIYAASAASASAASNSQPAHPPGAHTADALGADYYADRCAICHGEHREGTLPAFPSLLGIGSKMNEEQIVSLLHNGRGRMPAFTNLKQPELTSLVHYLLSTDTAAIVPATGDSGKPAAVHPSSLAEAGGVLFQQNCAFCHGRDAGGGEAGPDLTRSKLVRTDVGGDKISEVVRDGRPARQMPGFNFSSQQLLSLAAFIHLQESKAVAQKGHRRGVDVSDLQTGNVEAGKKYFDGAGTCAKCHSATGDLAGVASRYEGLKLEERMLFPRDVKNRVTVTLPSGGKIAGTLAYQDEFTVGMRDQDGNYHSWPTSGVAYVVDSPVNAHVDLFNKYTDDDIHNLMAYLQTLH